MRYQAIAALLTTLAAYGCERTDSRAAQQGATSTALELRGAAPPSAEAAGARDEAAMISAAGPGQAGGRAQEPVRGALPGSEAAAPAMIIRSGTASVEVDSLEPAIVRLQQVALRAGGYVANTTVQAGREQLRSATLVLKIPAARFDDAVQGLRPIGRVESVNVTAEDVSEEYVDITARVANARRLEDRVIQLLATRTGRLQDVLEVERELARVREEIERYEGRLRFLRTRAATSTLAVTVHEPMPIVGSYAGSSIIGGAFRTAWRNFVTLTAAMISSLGFLVPLALLVGAAWALARRFGWRPTGRRGPPGGAPPGAPERAQASAQRRIDSSAEGGTAV